VFAQEIAEERGSGARSSLQSHDHFGGTCTDICPCSEGAPHSRMVPR
jgi:hypothetical protein